MNGFLETMVRHSRGRVSAAKGREDETTLSRRALESPAPPRLRLHPRFDLIAEIKRSSPSQGRLQDGERRGFVADRARAYVDGGAAAVSVLTEPRSFGGSLEDLREAALACGAPVMRKDFLVDPYQILEARLAGASGVLLILRILDDAQLLEMLQVSRAMGLFVLLEAFDEDDLGRAATLSRTQSLGEDTLIGLNCRDLVSLETDPRRFERLRRAFPTGALCVAESGLETPTDVRTVAGLGYRLALVGGSLMRADDPCGMVSAMLAAGRGEAPRSCASA